MTSVELIVNDEQLDLYENTSVALVLQSQNFNELSERSSSFSRSFTIPKTDNNSRILKNVFTFNIADRLAYNKLNAVLKINGVEIGKGLIIIENDGIGYNEIRLTFYFDASPFYQLVSKKMLLDCNFNEFDHYYNHINIHDSFSDTKDYIYPFIQYQNEGNSAPYTGTNFFYARMDRMLPAIKFSAIIKAISKTLGYTIKGSIFDKEEFKTAIFPFAKDKFARDKYYYKRYTFNTSNNQIQTLTTNSVIQLTELDTNGNLKAEGLSVVPFSQYWNLSPSIPYINGFSNYNSLKYLEFPDNVKCNVTFKCDVYINTPNSNLIVVSNGSVVENVTATLTNQNTGQVILPTTGSTFASTLQIGTYSLEYKTIERFVAHNYWSIGLTSNKLNNNITNTTLDVTFIEDYGTTDENRLIWKTGEDRVFSSLAYGAMSGANPDYVDVPSGTGAGLYQATADGTNPIFPQPNSSWIPVPSKIINIKQSYSIVTAGTILPDITVGAFLKIVAQLFCCTLIVDENTRVVEFYSLEDTYKNLGNQLDWSDKLVNIETSTWNTRASNYGQQSIFSFVNYEKQIPAYLAPSKIGELGKGSIIVNDTTLEDSKKVIEIQYPLPKEIVLKKFVFPTVTVEYLIVWISKFFANSDNYREPQGDDNTFICNYYTTSDFATFGTLYWQGPNDNNSFLSNTPQIVIGISANGDKLPIRYTNPLASKKTIGFNFALNNHYRYIEYLLSIYKELNCYMILSSNDIANIDYRKPIYLEQFNSVFYLQKINDWSEGKPTKVELLKLI